MKKMKYVFALALLFSTVLRVDDVTTIAQVNNGDLAAQLQAFVISNGGTCQDQLNAFLALSAVSDSSHSAIQQSLAEFLNCCAGLQKADISKFVLVTVDEPASVGDLLEEAAAPTPDTITSVFVPVVGTVLGVPVTVSNGVVTPLADSSSQQLLATLNGTN